MTSKWRRRTRKASSVLPANERVCAVRRLACHAGPLSSGGGVRCESCAAVFSFPSRTAFRYPQSRTFAASPDAAKYPTLRSRPATLLGSTAPFAGLLPQTGGNRVSASPGPRAVCPHPASPDRFHRAESVTISVLVGQRDSQPEMGSASGLGSRLWSPSAWAEASQLRPALGLPTLGFVLFQVCGHTVVHRRGLDTATITSP